MAFVADLHNQIAAVCPPIVSIKAVNVANKATWVLDAPGATSAQLAAAQAVIDSYDVAAFNSKAQDFTDCQLATLRVFFNHENRIRALEGRAALARAQFMTAIRSLTDPT